MQLDSKAILTAVGQKAQEKINSELGTSVAALSIVVDRLSHELAELRGELRGRKEVTLLEPPPRPLRSIG